MEALRQIPPVHEVLKAPELERFRPILAMPFGARIVDEAFAETRKDLALSTEPLSRDDLKARIVRTVAARIEDALRPSLRRVINASGVVLHTNLGRAPLPESAVDHVRAAAVRYTNIEFDIATGARGKRDSHIEKLMRLLLNCEAAIVVNNNAAAVLLVLNTLGEGAEVIASRGEQVEIGGSFRIPEVMAKSGATLREVGTTNRTRIEDYENAINDRTRLLLRVHPSNFRMIGFTERPALLEFVTLGRKKNIPTFEDLGSGCLIDPRAVGIDDEPVVAASIEAGVDVVCFSGDKLLGGPQSGIIAGKRALIDKIRQNPLFRALRVDKLTIAALESVLLAYLGGTIDDVPVWRMLRTPAAELKVRAESLAAKLGGLVRVVQLTSVVGGGSAPETQLPSWGISVHADGLSDVQLEARLRQSEPPVIARIEEGRVQLDLRTVFPDEDQILCGILELLKTKRGQNG